MSSIQVKDITFNVIVFVATREYSITNSYTSDDVAQGCNCPRYRIINLIAHIRQKFILIVFCE